MSTRLPRDRKLGLALYGATLVGLGVLAYAARTHDRFPWDAPVARWFQGLDSPAWDRIMRGLSWIGEGPRFVPLMVALGAVLAVAGRRLEGVLLVAAGLSGAIAIAVKQVVERPRPDGALLLFGGSEGGFSFPSTHVVLYVVCFGFLAHVLAKVPMCRDWTRPALGLSAAAFIALGSVSRIYLGAHWPSDVLGGYLMGMLLLVPLVQAYQWLLRWPGVPRLLRRSPLD